MTAQAQVSDFNFDQKVLDPMDKLLADTQQDKERLKKNLTTIKRKITGLRNFLYEEWEITDWPELPKEFGTKGQYNLLKHLDNLNDGVGYALTIVFKFREAETRIMMERGDGGRTVRGHAIQNPQPIVIQQPPEKGGIGNLAARSQGFFGGFWDARITKAQLDYLREREAKSKPRITTNQVIRDPVEIGNEVSAVLVETKKFIMDCYRCFPSHRNRFFVLNVHDELRERITKLLATLEAFAFASTEIHLRDIRYQQIAQTGYYARIAEARAMSSMYMPMGPMSPTAASSGYRPGTPPGRYPE